MEKKNSLICSQETGTGFLISILSEMNLSEISGSFDDPNYI
jgi:hypothetical protein